MSLGDRVDGYEFSEIEKEFLFNRVDAGFVRYTTVNGRLFYLDPSPYLKTPKDEIFVSENCQPPRNQEFVEVSVYNVEDVIQKAKGSYSKFHKKYMDSWKSIDTNKIIRRRRLFGPEDITNFFKSPYLGNKDIIKEICLCSAFWDIARWCESERASQTVAWYQMESMGTRDAQYALLVPLTGAGVCAIKHIDGKIPQMVYWESNSPIVHKKQGTSCGGKGRTVEPLGQGHIFRTQMRVKGGNKTVLTTYPENGGGGFF